MDMRCNKSINLNNLKKTNWHGPNRKREKMQGGVVGEQEERRRGQQEDC